jgi:hypothetical protein
VISQRFLFFIVGFVLVLKISDTVRFSYDRSCENCEMKNISNVSRETFL